MIHIRLLIKILFILSSLSLFGGMYNFSWKTKAWNGIPIKYRNRNLAWVLFGAAFAMALIAFLLY